MKRRTLTIPINLVALVAIVALAWFFWPASDPVEAGTIGRNMTQNAVNLARIADALEASALVGRYRAVVHRDGAGWSPRQRKSSSSVLILDTVTGDLIEKSVP